MERSIETGDRVHDPHSGQWRTVTGVTDSTVAMADGGVMNIDECKHVLLPSEHEPGSTTAIADADDKHRRRTAGVEL